MEYCVMSYKEPLATTTDFGIVKVGNGFTVTNGVLVFGPAYYGKFSDSTTQTNPVINTTNIMNFNTIAASLGVSIVAGNRITFANPGVYQLIINVQTAKTDGGNDSASIWLSQNGVNVPNTDVEIELVGTTNTGYRSAAFLVTTTVANEFAQINWSSPDLGMQFEATSAQVAPVRPASPSVRLLVSQL